MITPSEVWSSWSWDPLPLAGIAVAAILYARGLRALGSRGLTVWHASAFYLGLVAVLVALVSPIDALSATLFSVHMVQHMLLVIVAAPLVMLGRPAFVLSMGLPVGLRRDLHALEHRRAARAIGHALSHPAVALGLHVVALWAWHAPGPYQLALRNPTVHIVEHLCFFSTALLFWWLIVDPRGRARLGYGPGILYVFIAGLQTSALGALLTFASAPLYPLHAPGALIWHLQPIQDQQLAGVIMWVPGGIAYLVAASALFLAWVASLDKVRLEPRPRNVG